MRTKLEGIILRKIASKERDLILSILTKEGGLVDIYCYGGRGGGPQKKSSLLEVGYFLNFEINRGKGEYSSAIKTQTAREWKLLWSHEFIRLNYEAFELLSFFCELVYKISLEDDLSRSSKYFGQKNESIDGSFSALSNGIFYLDKSCQRKENFSKARHLSVFLSKLIYQLGIVPDLLECGLCQIKLDNLKEIYLDLPHGHFYCKSCHSVKGDGRDFGQIAVECLNILRFFYNRPYKQIDEINTVNKETSKLLFQFLCYQFQLNQNDFKTISGALR